MWREKEWGNNKIVVSERMGEIMRVRVGKEVGVIKMMVRKEGEIMKLEVRMERIEKGTVRAGGETSMGRKSKNVGLFAFVTTVVFAGFAGNGTGVTDFGGGR